MSGWRRVNKEFPCPVCKKPDWCTVGDRAICCMRVVSNRPVANGGYLHPLDSKAVKLPPVQPVSPSINTTALMKRWSDHTPASQVIELARSLGIEPVALTDLRVAWAADHNAWAFQMRDGYGEPCGVRLRDNNGRKWAVTGSREGIFLPYVRPQSTAYVCEGPTDTAAALSLGVFAIGRPSCSGAITHTVTTFKRLEIARVVILSDNDSPGLAGAIRLRDALHIPAVIMVPPAKDIREFLRLGGTRALLESLTNALVWKIPV
jgi:5S rRNA maturation endonuclease (ribonuclease M5)